MSGHFPIGEEDEDDEELYNCSLQVSYGSSNCIQSLL